MSGPGEGVSGGDSIGWPGLGGLGIGSGSGCSGVPAVVAGLVMETFSLLGERPGEAAVADGLCKPPSLL